MAKHESFIVKVQTAQFPPDGPVLIYNEDRSIEDFDAQVPNIMKQYVQFKGGKCYFNARIIDGTLTIDAEKEITEWPNW